MNRKQFIESHGATCDNWTWSWSFKNEKEKFIIFGAWDKYRNGENVLIFDEDRRLSRKGRPQLSYKQSREHLHLIEDEGYRLFTFPMQNSEVSQEDSTAPSKIESFTPELSEKILFRLQSCWYAGDKSIDGWLPEEHDPSAPMLEGSATIITGTRYERNREARRKCIEHYGCKCAICEFDFASYYGSIGKDYIHVHHVVSLASRKKEYDVDPIRDLIPVCANCHAIIHRTRETLDVDDLRKHLKTLHANIDNV